jgi:hypothetical protein
MPPPSIAPLRFRLSRISRPLRRVKASGERDAFCPIHLPERRDTLERARAELSTAMELYRTMEITFWLRRVETALAQVGGQ